MLTTNFSPLFFYMAIVKSYAINWLLYARKLYTEALFSLQPVLLYCQYTYNITVHYEYMIQVQGKQQVLYSAFDNVACVALHLH